jgi:peptide/nickel transport system substrate-binding protein
MRKKGIPILLVFALLLCFEGLSSARKVICWGSASNPETMDPAQAWDDVSVFFATNIFETLVRLNPETFDIEPSLALSWETKKQGKMWVFKLRKNVKFHDGSDFNARAVVFSFRRQLDRKFEFRYFDFLPFEEIFRNINSVVAVDSHTVVFHLHDPFYPFLSSLSSSGASIISPTAVRKHKAKFFQNPVGTGPFKLKSWDKSERIVLVANPEYWKGKAGFDEFIYRVIPKYDQLHKLFRQGDIDILDSVSISRTVGLKNVKWATIHKTPALSVNFIVFNFKNKYLQNENIRRAIKYVWDDRVLKYIFQDFVVPLNSVIPQGLPGYRNILARKECSISKSRDLLDKEQIHEKIELVFVLHNDSSLEKQVVQLFSKNLNRVGINLNIQSVSGEEYKKKIEMGLYDLAISGWIADYPDSHNILSALFNMQYQAGGFANLSGYQDEELRRFINKIAIESNVWTRQNMIERIIRKIDDKTLCIPIYQKTYVHIYNNRSIEKVRISPHGYIDLFNIVKK